MDFAAFDLAVLAVAIGLAVLLPALRRRGARVGYAASCGGLLLTVLLPALTFLFVPAPAMPQSVLADVAASGIPDISVGTAVAPRSMPVMVRWMPDHALLRALDRPALQPASNAVPQAASTVEVSWTERAVSLGRHIQQQMPRYFPWIVVAWSLGVAIVSLWNIGGWFAVQQLKTQGTDPVTGTIQDAAARIARKLGLKCRVRLLRSTLVDTPLVIGALKPVILLPAALITELPADQLEALLAHELCMCCGRIISSICCKASSRRCSSIIRPSGGFPPRFARNAKTAAMIWRSTWRATGPSTCAALATVAGARASSMGRRQRAASWWHVYAAFWESPTGRVPSRHGG